MLSNAISQPQSWYSIKWQQLKNRSRELSNSWQMRWGISLLAGSSTGFTTYELMAWAGSPEALTVISVLLASGVVARRTSHTLSVSTEIRVHVEKIVAQINKNVDTANDTTRFLYNAFTLRNRPQPLPALMIRDNKRDLDAPITTHVELEELLQHHIDLPFPPEEKDEQAASRSVSETWHDCMRGLCRRASWGFFQQQDDTRRPINDPLDSIMMDSYQSDGETFIPRQTHNPAATPVR